MSFFRFKIDFVQPVKIILSLLYLQQTNFCSGKSVDSFDLGANKNELICMVVLHDWRWGWQLKNQMFQQQFDSQLETKYLHMKP